MKNKTPRLDLNPSSADRWTTCTASPGFIMENWGKVPERDETGWNTEGSTAHEIAAALLENRAPDPNELKTPVDAQMHLHAWNYMEYVLSFMEPGSTLTVETKKPLWYMPSRNAKVDAAVRNPGSLHIFDLKYGEGIPVSPVENKQLTIYAQTEGTQNIPFPEDSFPVFIHIYQPRGREGSGGVWETTWGEIQKLAEEIHAKAHFIQDPHARVYHEFQPSEKACQWCPAKGFCAARQEWLTRDIEVLSDFTKGGDSSCAALVKSSITRTQTAQSTDSGNKAASKAAGTFYPEPAAVSDDQIAKVLTHASNIKKWLDDVEDYALSQMLSGHSIPGFKLVMSRGGNRAWSDPQKAKELLLETALTRSEVVEEKVITPGAAEKLLGKRKFTAELTNLIVKPPGSPVIAPEDDKREAIGESAMKEIEVL